MVFRINFLERLKSDAHNAFFLSFFFFQGFLQVSKSIKLERFKNKDF